MLPKNCTLLHTEAKLRFANTSEENAKKISKQAKQNEKDKKYTLKKDFCWEQEYHVLSSAPRSLGSKLVAQLMLDLPVLKKCTLHKTLVFLTLNRGLTAHLEKTATGSFNLRLHLRFGWLFFEKKQRFQKSIKNLKFTSVHKNFSVKHGNTGFSHPEFWIEDFRTLIFLD